MIKYKKTILYKSFALALAAAISVTTAGCSGGAHTSSAPPDAPQAATEAAAVPSAPAGDTAAAETAEPAETAATAGTASTAAAAEADTAATVAAAETAETSATSSETAAADETSSTAEAAADSDADASLSDAAEAIKDGVPKRDKADTALKESVLSETLVECTGWGQSAGSSLHAAAASVMLLQWANDVDAANVDSKVLEDTVKAEVNRLSDVQQENLKENWSSISFDASMILDSYDEIAPVLEDAGCADAAKNLAGSKNTLANWEAVEHALNAVLK